MFVVLVNIVELIAWTSTYLLSSTTIGYIKSLLLDTLGTSCCHALSLAPQAAVDLQESVVVCPLQNYSSSLKALRNAAILFNWFCCIVRHGSPSWRERENAAAREHGACFRI